MTKPTTRKTPLAPTSKPPAKGASLIPDVPREESEDAFRKFLEEVDLDDDDDAAIKARIATLSGEGDIVDDE